MNGVTKLIASDLDGTLLPNGIEAEPEGAREQFGKFVDRSGLILTYVTGRHLASALSAIEEYGVPRPDFLVTDVGTQIYKLVDESYCEIESWRKLITQDWKLGTHNIIYKKLSAIHNIQPQENEHQSEFKLSFYTDESFNSTDFEEVLIPTLKDLNIHVHILFSTHYDGRGYLDILPATANKHEALSFLQKTLNVREEDIVFAGDSGNDIDALTSGFKGIVVGNTTDTVKNTIKEVASLNGTLPNIYFANKYYSAGVLQGLHHFDI